MALPYIDKTHTQLVARCTYDKELREVQYENYLKYYEEI